MIKMEKLKYEREINRKNFMVEQYEKELLKKQDLIISSILKSGIVNKIDSANMNNLSDEIRKNIHDLIMEIVDPVMSYYIVQSEVVKEKNSPITID